MQIFCGRCESQLEWEPDRHEPFRCTTCDRQERVQFLEDELKQLQQSLEAHAQYATRSTNTITKLTAGLTAVKRVLEVHPEMPLALTRDLISCIDTVLLEAKQL